MQKLLMKMASRGTGLGMEATFKEPKYPPLPTALGESEIRRFPRGNKTSEWSSRVIFLGVPRAGRRQTATEKIDLEN